MKIEDVEVKEASEDRLAEDQDDQWSDMEPMESFTQDEERVLEDEIEAELRDFDFDHSGIGGCWHFLVVLGLQWR